MVKCLCRFAGLVALAWTGFASAAGGPMGVDDARHLLARAGFAPDAAEIRRFAALPRDEAVERLLAGARTTPVTPVPSELDDYMPPRLMRGLDQEQRRQITRRQLFTRGGELRAWWLGEMLATDSPLTERMTLFWHNHFVSSQDKVRSPRLMLDQNLLLRQHALGNFGKLLHAVSKDPAMLIYLDAASNRKGQPNENFAREVMELFTLGEGHYTERDIKEAARAFTGWAVEPESGRFVFRAGLHDAGNKTLFGRTGPLRGEDVLDLLLARPETARFIAAKLWREFASPQPDPAAEARVAEALRTSGYEIRPALRALFLSDAFWAPGSRGALIKSPVDLVVGTLRSLHAEVPDPAPFARTLRQLGQDLFAPPNVRGWPGAAVWINTSTLLARKQFLDRVARASNLGQPGGGMPNRDMDMNGRAWRDELAASGLTPQAVLLAVAPVEAPATAMSDQERLRALLLDAAYQVK